MEKGIKLKGFCLLATFFMLTLSSCTVNDNGDLEITWVFWVILVALVATFIGVIYSTHKEAEERGISVDELIEEQKKEREQKEMTTGFEVEYLGGYPKWANPCKVNFSIENSAIVLGKDNEKMVITRDMIVSMSNEKSAHRSVGKTAAGAIVGGVLTGGIGLIVGGALGARKTDTSEVFITYKYDDVELTLNLKPGKNTDKVYSWINTVFA